METIVLPAPALHLLAGVDPDQLAPKQALDLVYELIRLVGPVTGRQRRVP